MPDNKDLNQRFDQLEKRLESMAVASVLPTFDGSNTRADEIDLRELFGVLWRGKWWIIAITFLFAVAGVAYALSLPNMYKSEGIYAPAQKEGAGGGMGQLGGLAAMAGMSLGGGESNDIDQAIALITSWPFLAKVIDKHNLKPLIMGVKGWRSDTGELVWDDKVYDPNNKRWLRESALGKESEPSSYEAYIAFSRMITMEFDKTVSLLSFSVEHYSPEVSRNWVALLAEGINEAFRERDVRDAKKNIEYLEQKIGETGLTGMHAVFYGMIESQMKTLMLAEVEKEYLMKTVVEPMEAEVKSGPKRALLTIVFGMLGGVSSLFFILGKFIIHDRKNGVKHVDIKKQVR